MDKKMVDLSDLDKLKNKIDYQGKKLLNIRRNICLFDTFCIAQLNRSLNLIDAFIVLSKMNNYITSLALVRIHLDTLLRLYAVKLTQQDVNQVVEKILNGKPIKKFKDGTTKKLLTDSYLKDKISEMDSFTWVKETYEKSSGFVHFSDYILKVSNLGDASTMTIYHSIKVGNDFVTDFDKKVACVQMIKITEGILCFINKWIEESEQGH
ncbi:hypothetical protein [Cloacibacterium normanense]|uniref:hypothetical protein n=1 Tax=Cloacibacterium normanense TaxID=237258 RepID=UPI0039188F3F